MKAAGQGVKFISRGEKKMAKDHKKAEAKISRRGFSEDRRWRRGIGHGQRGALVYQERPVHLRRAQAVHMAGLLQARGDRRL
jgi:hypothetical protein